MRKFTVAHVQRDPQLRQLAIDYLGQWAGEFDFLSNAKQAIESGEGLRPEVVKGILNCMLADANVRNMPEVPDLSFDAGGNPFAAPSEDTLPSLTLSPDRRRLEFEMRPKPKYGQGYHGEVPMKTKWNKPHIISMASNAKLVHEINPHTSYLDWWKGRDDWNGRDFRWKMELYCDNAFWMKGVGPRFQFTSRYVFLTPREAFWLVEKKALELPWTTDLQGNKLADRDWKWCMKCGITKGRDQR